MRGWTPLVGVQFEYSLVERSAERELLPMAESLGLAALLWSPLAGGLLTGKYRVGEKGRLEGMGRVIRTEKTAHDTQIVDAVLLATKELGRTPAEVALAWTRERARRASTAVIPIIGPRTVEQLDNNLSALDIAFPDELYDRLDQVSSINLGVPFEVNLETYPKLLGGDLSRVDVPITKAI
ncbi:putative oxidoreductase [Candidatus Burkholderia verschuerenii]|uniref:Putative oxidoreductase n=1 Tax=Candidatus Burkholderia verschuerenii TaxID=242163 RepID=A0A0L0MIV7_9BURK|nr:aldo/keto reductase [Candidatus Burkholderia verschuerenii]KND61929.1 putative oxidoreductase [Candidatus Burkholderia verschuerenii]